MPSYEGWRITQAAYFWCCSGVACRYRTAKKSPSKYVGKMTPAGLARLLYRASRAAQRRLSSRFLAPSRASDRGSARNGRGPPLVASETAPPRLAAPRRGLGSHRSNRGQQAQCFLWSRLALQPSVAFVAPFDSPVQQRGHSCEPAFLAAIYAPESTETASDAVSNTPRHPRSRQRPQNGARGGGGCSAASLRGPLN